MDTKDSALKAYEDYVLSDKSIEEGLRNLVEGTETHTYLKAIDLITKKGLNLTEKEKVFIKKYRNEFDTSSKRKIELRWLMLKYDAANSPKKTKILQKLNDRYLKLNFFHIRPDDLFVKSLDEDKLRTRLIFQKENVFDRLNLDQELEFLYTHDIRFNDFEPLALAKVKVDKLSRAKFIQYVEHMIDNLNLLEDNDLFWEIFAKTLEKNQDLKAITGALFPIANQAPPPPTEPILILTDPMAKKMTIEQMDKLKSKVPKIEENSVFAGNYFAKKFSQMLSSEKENLYMSDSEKHESLIKMYEYSKTLPPNTSGPRGSLLLEILEMGLKLNIFNEKYFLEYLEVPKKYNRAGKGLFGNAQIQRNRNQETQLLHENSTLNRKYLEHFFLQGKTIEDYKELLSKSLLTEVYEETMLMSGKKVQFTSENNARLEAVIARVDIIIQSQNKDYFNIGEEVSLFVELKNVPVLSINVFEINAENYYRTKMEPFRTDINLDGLVASIERIIKYDKAPYIKFRETLSFPELKGKLGLYVIELIGNGKSSRAVIKIGALSVITKQTVAGQVCYILDEERKICCDESTGIWMAGQYFKADIANRGRIIVPHLTSEKTKTEKAILLHKGLAQFVDIVREEEVYSFKCGFCLLPESIIMGKIATVLVRPQLFINGRLASLKLLKNVRCAINTSNYIDNIPSTKTISNLKLSENEELPIQFQVGANISKLQITFNADIQNITKDKIQTLTSSHDFIISNHTNDLALAEFYLRLNPKREYELQVLGKNGEPIEDCCVTFEFTVNMMNRIKYLSRSTNKEGVIKIGKMEGVVGLNVGLNEKSGNVMSKYWSIPSKTAMQYPECIDVIEDEVVELPIVKEDKGVLCLRSKEQDQIISDFTKAIKVISDDTSLYSTIKISGLKGGTYFLTGLKNSKIDIKVHKGVYWSEDSNYILKQYSLLENTEKQGFIKIKSVDFEEGKSQLRLDIEGATKDQWRIHVMLFRYLPLNLNDLTSQLLARDNFRGYEYFFQKWKNFYLSNRELSDEFNYCFNRPGQPQFTGNMLEKPTLLLKRTLVQSTHTEQEILERGTEHARIEEQPIQAQFQQNQSPSFPRQTIPQVAKEVPMKVPSPMQPCIPQTAIMPINALPRAPDSGINTYQNFIEREPLLRYNIPATDNGKIILELGEEFQRAYTCALVVAVDKGSVTHYVCPLPGDDLKKKDLSLTKALDVEKSYCEMRTAKCINKFETYRIDDIASSELKIVDSLEKVYFVITELMRLYNIKVTHLNKFTSLLNWYNLEEEKKNEILSRLTSHELHLFIYKKDPEFFDKTVKSFLQNKMEKTFIDHYLLGNVKEVLKFGCSSLFAKLNPLEKALLAEVAGLNGKQDLAKTVAQELRNDLLNSPRTGKEQNRIFDTVLSLGALKTKQEGVQKMIEEEKAAVAPIQVQTSMNPQIPQTSSSLFSQQQITQNPFQAPSQPCFGFSFEALPCTAQVNATENSSMPSCAFSSRPSPAPTFPPVNRPLASLFGVNAATNNNMLTSKIPTHLGNNGTGLFNEPMNARVPTKKILPILTELGETKEYAETNYYGESSIKTSTNLVKASEFWVEYAEYFAEGKSNKPFLTHQFITAFNGLPEILGVLSLLDLPYRSLDHGFKTLEGLSAELKAVNNLLIFKKEVKETTHKLKQNILVAQQYQDYLRNDNQNYKIEEFLVNRIYTGIVTLINVSTDSVELDVLTQIPQGSLPIGLSPYQKTHSIALQGSSSQKIIYMFYFPQPGKFTHYPPTVSVNSIVVAKGFTEELVVVRLKEKMNVENFRDVLSTGDRNAILKFIKNHPPSIFSTVGWENVYWLLKDIKFYEQLVSIMKGQLRFNSTVWSYSVYHKNNEEVLIEYLNSLDYLKSMIGYYFDSKLIAVRPIDSMIRHLDYHPLINARVHKNLLGGFGGNSGRHLILNAQLYDTYKRFIFYLIEKPVWDLADKMSLAYFMLLQDKITEALKIFSKIDPETEIEKEGRLRLQYDYMAIYLDFYTGMPEYKTARTIVAKYLDYPIISWRLLFLDIDQQLKDYDGIETEEEVKELAKKKVVSLEPQLDVTLKEKSIVIEYNNITEITVKYYIINLEVLFSRRPFLTKNAENFSYVKPSSYTTFKLDAKTKELTVEIPKDYTKQNVLIEVNCGAIQKLITYFSTLLKLQIYQNYGELKVTDENGKQLPQVYVKVFVSKKDHSVSFYKDGYTDIRGRFDYASANASNLSNIENFALYIAKDKYGSLIRECKPPANILQEEDIGPVKTRLANYYISSKG